MTGMGVAFVRLTTATSEFIWLFINFRNDVTFFNFLQNLLCK
jgi:hypothetical protein